MTGKPEGTAGLHKRHRPVERFLGPDEAAGGPFALLGVSPAACTDELVLSALDRQVERINRHPECDTPEADEVRLALHAAAAQLLDPVVRRHLIARWTGVKVAPPPVAPVRVASTSALAAPVSTRLLEADAVLALGLYGGWNNRALRRLVSLAHARGFSTAQVAETLRNLGGRRRRAAPKPKRPVARQRATKPPVSLGVPPQLREPRGLPPDEPRVERPAPRRVNEPLEEQIDPGQQLLRNAVLFGGVGLVALIGAAVLILLLTMPPGTKPATPVPVPPKGPSTGGGAGVSAPTGAAPAPVERPRESPPAAKTPPKPVDPTDLAALVREIAACAEAIQSEPMEATARFERAVERLAATWTKVPRDRLIACHDSIVEFIYKAGGSAELTARGVAAVARGAAAMSATGLTAEQVSPAVWSVGMLSRLAREKDLSAAAKSGVESQLAVGLGASRGAVDPTFEAGAVAALYEIPNRLIPTGNDGRRGALDVEAWKNWADAADAVGGADPKLRLRLLLTGLETLLVHGPEPNADKSAAEVIGALVVRVTWRPEDESRHWLLRWFDDKRISNADLYAITSTLATKSGAEGIDLTMVLSTSAAEKTRADLRERYATVWSMQAAMNGDELTAAWIKAAKDAINNSYATTSEHDELYHAVVLSRLNEAAMWQWRGEGAEAANIVSNLLPPVEAALKAVNPYPAAPKLSLSDGGWGEKYLAARQNVKVRKEMLEQLPAHVYDLGSVDAEILVNEAIFGSPSDIRALAIEQVKRFASSPQVINGVVEKLPRMPRNLSSTVLIECICQRQLPAVKDADWPIVARRLLIEKLVEAIAAESPMAKIDRLSVLLALSYRSMAAPAPLAADQRALAQQPAASGSAAQVWQSLRKAAETAVPTTAAPMTLDQIDRRRAGRLSQAKGMIQSFAAEQASICEVLAYLVNTERPGGAEQIKLVLSQMADERRRSMGVLEQLRAAERAMTQLWLLRLEQEEPKT